MVVTENSTNNVNQSFNDFINDQKYVFDADPLTLNNHFEIQFSQFISST